MKHEHYFKNVKSYDYIDVYRVLHLFEVKDPCIQHAVKKLLAAGIRGNKTELADIQEAIDSLERWKSMKTEDSNTCCKHDLSIKPDRISEYNIHSMSEGIEARKNNQFNDSHKNRKCRNDDMSNTLTLSNHSSDTINISEIQNLNNDKFNYHWDWDNVNIQPLKIDTLDLSSPKPITNSSYKDTAVDFGKGFSDNNTASLNKMEYNKPFVKNMYWV